MMGYVVKGSEGEVVVIDGGRKEDAPFLRSFLLEHGGIVKRWLITHPHKDHIGALSILLKEPGGITIQTLYGAFLDESVMEKCDPNRLNEFLMLRDSIRESGVPFVWVTAGRSLDTSGIKIDVLSGVNPEILQNCMNNSSIVYKLVDDNKSALFLGDLGVEGGEKLLRSSLSQYLESDYVQMAHHGQRGVGFNVYKRISPKVCLWPTPLWLWDNDNGGGYNSGPWDTLRVRRWMDEINVKKHYIMADGLSEIH